jgi:hypothetical protein
MQLHQHWDPHTMLDDQVLSRITGTIIRGVERISTREILQVLGCSERETKLHIFWPWPCLGLDFPELGDVTMRKTWRERQRQTAAGTADGCPIPLGLRQSVGDKMMQVGGEA